MREIKIILASQSEKRRKALDLLELKHETCDNNFDEKSIRDENPLSLALKLAEAKAKKAGKKC